MHLFSTTILQHHLGNGVAALVEKEWLGVVGARHVEIENLAQRQQEISRILLNPPHRVGQLKYRL
jgi:hypothetical protein